MNWKRATGIILIAMACFLAWSNVIFTGAVIGLSSSLNFFVVLIFILGLILVFTVGIGGLEKKLFYRDKGGVVRIKDIMGDMDKEGVPDRMPADQAIKKLEKYTHEDKELFSQVFMPYIETARQQVDAVAGRAISLQSEEWYAHMFLRMFDSSYKGLIHGNIVPISFADRKGYVKVRHYTSSSRADKIAGRKQFGGDNAPRLLDQGKVFVELASMPVLSQQEFVERYAIANRDLGQAYVDFIVPETDLDYQINKRNNKKEYFIKTNAVENKKRIYRILSEVRVTKR